MGKGRLYIVFASVMFLHPLRMLYGQELRLFTDLLRMLGEHQDEYSAATMMDECERFLDAYPLSDSASIALELYAKAASQRLKIDWRKACVYLTKSKMVYNSRTRVDRLRDLFDQCVARMDDWALGAHFDETQKAELRRRLSEPPRYAAKSRRAFEYLKLLHSISTKKTVDIFLSEFRWFIKSFPTAPAGDTVRFWRAQLLSMKGKHREASSAFLAISPVYPTSKLRVQALTAAADELCEKPVWDFKRAVDILTRGQELLPESEWQPLLERKVTILVDNLHEVKNAWKPMEELVERFPQSFVLKEEVFRYLLNDAMNSGTGNLAAVGVANRYLALYPWNSFAARVRKWFEEGEIHNH